MPSLPLIEWEVTKSCQAGDLELFTLRVIQAGRLSGEPLWSVWLTDATPNQVKDALQRAWVGEVAIEEGLQHARVQFTGEGPSGSLSGSAGGDSPGTEPLKTLMPDDDPARRKSDRRSVDRLRLPPCERCGRPFPRVRSRTGSVLFLSCDNCGHGFGVRLPERSSDPQ
jgi:hypothetical protein